MPITTSVASPTAHPVLGLGLLADCRVPRGVRRVDHFPIALLYEAAKVELCDQLKAEGVL